MSFNNISIGIDIEENSRFEGKSKEKDSVFLDKIFTSKELEYCFSDGRSAQHLCARYCGKEAVVKALYGLDIKDVYYKDIEILNQEDGVPYVQIVKYPNIEVKISLSHSKSNSVAYVILKK